MHNTKFTCSKTNLLNNCTDCLCSENFQYDSDSREDKLMTAIADKRASRKEDNNYIIPETTHVISARKHITSAFGLFDQPQSTLLQPREK